MESSIIYYIYIAITLLVSIGLHEYAHAYASYKLGDPTPKLQGRLTINPLKHLDPIGTLCLIFFRFGRGKPVQINPSYYKHPGRDELITSLAWPAMNLLLATIGMFLMMLYASIFGGSLQSLLLGQGDLVITFWTLFIFVNISLAAFNLLPIPPLDWYRLIKIFWRKGAQRMEQHMMIFIVVLLVLIYLPWNPIGTYISVVSDTVYRVLFTLFSLIFY